MVNFILPILVIGVLLLVSPLQAAETDDDDISQPSDALLEPQVTIVRGKHGVFEEYRRNGFLYQVKVIPDWGLPYYLIDNDGDGQLETRIDDFDSGLMLPHWLLFSW